MTLELGTDPISGKRKRIYFKVDTADRQEAENMLVIKKAEYLQGEIIEPSRKTVGQFLEEYMRDYVRVHSSPANTFWALRL